MVILIVLFLFIAVFAAVSLYIYRVAFYSPPQKRPCLDDPMNGEQYEPVMDDIRRSGHIMERYPCEDVWITSFDGCRLHGRYYHMNDGAPLKIVFHGYRSCAFRDCSGAHLLSRKLGFNLLAVDQRAHGQSEGKTISFGIREHQDCAAWAYFAKDRFGSNTPIILSGLSMGAATILMALGLDLPSNVACVLADSPYSAPSAIIEKVCTDLRYPVLLCRPFIHLSALLYGGFILNACTAKDAVKCAKVPILLIHGEDDRLVPCAMSHEIANLAASPVTVKTFPHAGHGLSYLTDPFGYERTIYDFLSSVPQIKDHLPKSFFDGEK